MENNKRQLRMYGLVPYNLSPIQQGIQFGHAVVEYGLTYSDTDDYRDWAKNHKTFIILNGGTTNSRVDLVTRRYAGTLNQHLEELNRMGIQTASFYEPDLGDQLTAVVFLVDDRVFDKELYPDFNWYIFPHDPEMKLTDIEYQAKLYNEWVESVGGEKNASLRQFLSQFKLA